MASRSRRVHSKYILLASIPSAPSNLLEGMKPLMLGSFPKTRSASVQDGESTIIESEYDDESYFEEIVESDEEIIEEIIEETIEEIVEDSDEETGSFDDQSTAPYDDSDSSSVAFDDGSSVGLQSLNSSGKINTIQDELNQSANQSAAFQGTRKAMEEELERDKSRARQAGLEALRQGRLEQEIERLAEEDEEDASHMEETEEERRKRQEIAILKQKEQDEDAHRRLAEEIKRVDVALSRKRDTLAYTKLQGPDHMEKRKKALAELRRQAARQELARNNDALKATRISRGGGSVASQRGSASVPYQKRDPLSPTGSDPGYVEHASVPGTVDSVDIYLRTPAQVSPMKFGGALTPATASKLDFGNVTSPYLRMETLENERETIEEESVSQALMNNEEKEDETIIESPETKLDFGSVISPSSRMETPENESVTIDEESVPQALMNNKEKEDETSIESPEAIAKDVEVGPAIKTEDVGNTIDQALVFERKAADVTEELHSEQEANIMANAGGALTPATACKQSLMNNKEKKDETSIETSEAKLDFGSVTSPSSRMETPENESVTIDEESVPQASMNNKEKEDEASIEAPEAIAKNVEVEPAINTEDVGNTTDQALGFERKDVDETEEVPSEQEANIMADAAQECGSTGSNHTQSQRGLQNGVDTAVPMASRSDSASKRVPQKPTSSVLATEAAQESKTSSEKNMVSREAPSDTERTPITAPKKRFIAPKTTDISVLPSAFQTFVKPLTNSDTTNTPSPDDLLPGDWDGKYHTMDDLRQSNIPGCDNTRREQYLSPEDFQEYFKLTKEEFAKFPKWKRDKVKRSLGLF